MINIKLKVDASKEKLRGGYYTPYAVTEYIKRYIFKIFKNPKILEPSVGDGAFLVPLKQSNEVFNLFGIELLEEEAEKANTIVKKDDRFEIINDDFYEYYHDNPDEKFDCIIGNPPYIRYQYLTSSQKSVQSEILKSNNMKPNKLINTWMVFTVACTQMLRNNGIIALVLPTDFLQVAYARQLREQLKRIFSELTIINFENAVFEKLQQDVIILIGRKKSKNNIGHQLRLATIESAKELSKLNIESIPFEDDDSTNYLYAQDKWNFIYLTNTERRIYQESIQSRKTVPTTVYFKSEVGITTGNNKVFAVNNDTVKKFNLDYYKTPLLGRSVESSGVLYGQKDIDNNKVKGKNIWLLDFNFKFLNEGALEYILFNEERKEHLGYKLGLRNKWYEVPSISIPDAFMLRRIGSHPKIILNEARATSTDTFHRINFQNGINEKLVILLIYSSFTMLSYEVYGRVFSGGALEILPGDLRKMQIPKISDTITINTNLIEEYFNELDNKLRNNEEIENVVKWIDTLVINFTEFTKRDFKVSYNSWIKIRNKRLKTKKL